MKISYISYLYDLDVKENECSPTTKPSIKENQLYEELQQMLCKSQFQKVMDLLDEYGERMAQKCEFYFKKGFRYGMNFVIESFNEPNE